MITKDISIYESGSGGEIAVEGDDIALVEQLFNQCYLAFFGGNIEASTLGNEIETEVRNDWWGNSLLFPQQPEVQFNSQTEKALRSNALNSVGRVNIQRAVDADLQYLNTIADIKSNVVILSTNKVQISVAISQPSNQTEVLYQIIWDNAKSEPIVNKII